MKIRFLFAVFLVLCLSAWAQQITNARGPELTVSGGTLSHGKVDGTMHVPKTFGIPSGYILRTHGGSADAFWSAESGGGYTLPVATASVLGGIKSSSSVHVDGTTGVATVDSVRKAGIADSSRASRTSDTARASWKADTAKRAAFSVLADSSRASHLSDSAKAAPRPDSVRLSHLADTAKRSAWAPLDSVRVRAIAHDTAASIRTNIHDSMVAERHFDTTVSRAVAHDTANALRSQSASTYLPLAAGSGSPLTGQLFLAYGYGLGVAGTPAYLGVVSTAGGGFANSAAGDMVIRGSGGHWLRLGTGYDATWNSVMDLSGVYGVAINTPLTVYGTTTLASTLNGILRASSGVVSASALSVGDLPASIQTAQAIPADRIAIGNGSAGLAADSGLQLLRKTSDPYSGYQIKVGKATMGTWSSDTTIAWFGAADNRGGYSGCYGITTNGTTTIVGAQTSVKMRATNGDALTATYSSALGPIATGNFQPAWNTAPYTLPATGSLSAGATVWVRGGLTIQNVTVANAGTEVIWYNNITGGVRASATTLNMNSRACSFVYLGSGAWAAMGY